MVEKNLMISSPCLVEVKTNRSKVKAVPLGCVQGSVLSPRLFNPYTSWIATILPVDTLIISYTMTAMLPYPEVHMSLKF